MKRKIRISIVIPTLNEEQYLPKLLAGIKKQTFTDYEVIVADAGSKDKTVSMAKEYGAKVVKGGSPAVGRNAGARAAKGDFLFFLDADVKLPKDFLKNAYDEMQDRYIDLATCEFIPLSSLKLDKVIHSITNFIIRMTLKIDPKAYGFCIFVTKRLFDRIGGFDETVKVGEDSEFVKRGSDIRPLKYLYSTRLWVSVRRFKKEGRLALARKGIILAFHRTFKGEVRKDIIEYEFGNYDEKKDKDRKGILDKVEKMLINMEGDYKKAKKKVFIEGIDVQDDKEYATQSRKEFEKVLSTFKEFFKRPTERELSKNKLKKSF
ncbi:MAG: glycosyltransferase [Spirochaetota bacterium]